MTKEERDKKIEILAIIAVKLDNLLGALHNEGDSPQAMSHLYESKELILEKLGKFLADKIIEEKSLKK